MIYKIFQIKYMRNIYSIMAVAIMAAATFLSCQKQEMEEHAGSTLTLSSDSDLSAKTEWSGQTIEWSMGDAVMLAYRHEMDGRRICMNQIPLQPMP